MLNLLPRKMLPIVSLAVSLSFLALPVMAKDTAHSTARDACLAAAQTEYGESFTKIERRVQKGSSAYEFWIVEPAKDLRVYCKYSLRRKEVDTLVALEPGQFRP